MTEEDEEFNRIERETDMRLNAVSAALADHRAYASEYERGFIDGMQKQAQSSVDKAVNAMSKPWVGLTKSDLREIIVGLKRPEDLYKAIEAKLKEKNEM
jgi:hypothetical protein